MRSVASYTPRSVAELQRQFGNSEGPDHERHPLDLPAPAALPQPVYFGPTDLTTSQQLALLMLSRNDLAKECVAKLYNMPIGLTHTATHASIPSLGGHPAL